MNIFQLLTLINPYEISDQFINTYPNFFNYRSCAQLSNRERHDKLGPKRNKFYKVSKAKFVKNHILTSN